MAFDVYIDSIWIMDYYVDRNNRIDKKDDNKKGYSFNNYAEINK